ncbi:glycosyltransferase family 1 protein [Candidatus Bathyarchaeota archaeon]|nr:MAG: glycosyltransferase family 1 protein [Candidatus Bathyarchaeota archaeon]
MKIAMISPYFHPVIGGIETYVLELSRELINQGHEVFVFTSNKTMAGEYDLFPKYEEKEGIKIFRFKVFPITRGVEFWFGFIRKLLEINPDIVHGHKIGFSINDLCAYTCRMKKIPCIATTHGVPYISSVHKEPFLRDIYLRTVPCRTVKLFDQIIAISPIELPWLRRSGVPDDRLHIISGGVSRRIFEVRFDPEEFKEKYGIESCMILYLGRLADKKGIDHLIRATPILLKDLPDLKVVIAGPDCGMMRKLKKLAYELRVEKNIVFTGPLSEKEKYAAIASSEALVLPSSFEAQGLVLMEAQALGTPVIATRQGGVPYFIKDYENGILIDYGRPTQIAEALKKVLNDEKLAHKLGETGKSIAKKYTWDRIAEKILSVYEDALVSQR